MEDDIVSSIFERPQKNKKSDITRYLNSDDIKNNVDFNYRYEKDIERSLGYVSQGKKLTQKAIKIWEGIMRHQPFDENNEVAALLVADAFLRKNGFRYNYKISEQLTADLYCWHLKDQKTVINGQFLNVVFELTAIKRNVPVWGMKEDMKQMLEHIDENFKSGGMQYEK